MTTKITLILARSFGLGFTVFSPTITGLCFEIYFACFTLAFWKRGIGLFSFTNFWVNNLEGRRGVSSLEILEAIGKASIFINLRNQLNEKEKQLQHMQSEKLTAERDELIERLEAL